MSPSPSKKSNDTFSIDQTIGKTVFDVSQTIGAVGLEGMEVAGTNVGIVKRDSKPVNVQEIDIIFMDLLKEVFRLVEPERRELVENLVLSLKSEAYKGDNAQVDTIEIIFNMIADVGEKPFKAIYDKLTLPGCPLAPAFREAVCLTGKKRFKHPCPQNS
jgi:hypothetical protein